jgi:hypothetical protein
MNMEVVAQEFFPMAIDRESATFSGSLRIHVIFGEFKINLSGIFCSRKKDRWLFCLPGRKAMHAVTGLEVRYNYFYLEDKELQRQLMDKIRQRGQDFIEKRLADNENPLVVPNHDTKERGESKPSHSRDNAMAPKETTASVAKPTTNPAIASKVWIDPPKRIQPARKSFR